MKIILFWMCSTTICLLAIGYITITEIVVSTLCAVLLMMGGSLLWLWHTGLAADRTLVEGAVCILVVPLILYWASTYRGSLDCAGTQGAESGGRSPATSP